MSRLFDELHTWFALEALLPLHTLDSLGSRRPLHAWNPFRAPRALDSDDSSLALWMKQDCYRLFNV